MKEYLLVGILFGMILLAGCAQTQTQSQQQGQMVGNDRDAHGCIPSAGYSWCEAKQKCYRPWEENCTAQAAPECTTVADCGVGAASCINGTCSQYDAHGCVPDGGYTWCEAKQKCIRPWEENCTTAQPLPGGTTGTGKECTTVADCGLGAASCVNGTCSQYDAHGCVPDGGYTWCEAKQKCIRPWEENCTATTQSPLETKAKTYCNKQYVAKVYTCGQYIRTVSELIGGGSTFYDVNGTEITTCPVVALDYMSPQCRQLLLGDNCVEKEIC